ncbi:MAG: hypothetical protein ACXVFV_02400 [Mycobacteriales bacterium]
MPHALLLFPALPSKDYLSELVDRGVLRAASPYAFGSYAGAGIAYSETTDGLVQAQDLACPGDPGCVGGLLSSLSVVPHINFPADFNLSALLTLHPHETRRWAAHARRVVTRDGEVTASAALVYGIEDVHGLVVVSGADLEETSERLLDLTDHPGVAASRSAVITLESAKGWGSELARLP